MAKSTTAYPTAPSYAGAALSGAVRNKLLFGIRGSLAAGAIILAAVPLVNVAGPSNPAALSAMAVLVLIAVLVYNALRQALGSRVFTALGPIAIGGAAAGVALLTLGMGVGAYVIAASYWLEPIMGYYVYRALRPLSPRSSLVFLLGAAIYAYSLPLALTILWPIPELADAVKVVALTALHQALREK